MPDSSAADRSVPTAPLFTPQTERERAVFGLWRRVNEIACSTEDTAAIRSLIAEARIEPGVHVGSDPEAFTPLMVGEWVLGQWADMIDASSPFINSARNISLHQYGRLTGEDDPPWTVGEGTMFPAEVGAIVDHFGNREATA
jgi:hypothetical protein